MQPFIVIGDRTSHDGRVIGCSATTVTTHKKVIARVGDKVTCPRCGDTKIATGDSSMIIMGNAAARQGDKTACGATLISGQSVTGSRISAPLARNDNEAADGAVSQAATKPVARPDREDSPNDVRSDPQRCVLHIGVFFDGTNNNAINTAMGDKCRASMSSALGENAMDSHAIAAHCKPYMKAPTSSFANGITNIWRLHELYRNDLDQIPISPGEKLYSRIYVDGIGTRAGKADHPLPGQAFGTGETGMLSRVEKLISSDLPQRIELLSSRQPAIKIRAIELDVFGFSRGAAAARHFVNEINKGPNGLAQTHLQARKLAFAEGLDWNQCIRVNFVGLFDTVSARASLSDGFDVRAGKTGPLKVSLSAGCARHVVQLRARDEMRANFMLTTVNPEHREISLPGVHSDIGGGYHADREGPLLLTKPFSSKEAFRHEHGNTYFPDQRESAAWQQAEEQRIHWKSALGNIDDRHLTVESWTWIEHRRNRHSSASTHATPRVYAAVRLERPIDWRYQLIPFRLMHKVAVEAGVPLDPLDEQSPELSLSAELQAISERLLSGEPLSDLQEELLRRKYLHQSANWNFELGEKHIGRGPVSLELVYVNRPEPSGRRTILSNK